jgi:RimJ/RimL family protein N-acetyltransferase
MRLIPLDAPELIALVAGWLAEKENFQWFDFGGGRQQLTPALVKIMAQRETNVVRVFTADDDETPIGVVGLQNVDRHFKTATIWTVLGNKAYCGRFYPGQAVSKMLTFGFQELGLGAINTWTVEHNRSVAYLKRLKFRYIERQRRCHYIDGQPFDRLLFDLLSSEHPDL